MNWEASKVTDLCISILLNNMGWYFGVIGKIHNTECLIYIFTGKCEIGTPGIFNKILYHSWYKQLRNESSYILINPTNKNVHFYNQINGEIPNSAVFDPETINPHGL